MKRILTFFLLLTLCVSAVSAAPSIGVLAPSQEASVSLVTGSTQQPVPEDTFTGDSVAAQYSGTLAQAVTLAQATQTDTGSNGHGIVESIPSVEEIVTCFAPDYAPDPLAGLKQLTYLQDLKYTATRLPVPADAWGKSDCIRVKLPGSELTRDASKEEFVIVLFDTKAGTVHLLEMRDYDPGTGNYTVDFPCIGPYMLTWRSGEAQN